MDFSALIGWFGHLPLAILVFVRVSTLIAVGPILGDMNTPGTIKALLSLAVTMIITPMAVATHPANIPFDGLFIMTLMREAMVGLSMGFLVNIYVQSIKLGGDFINRHAGFSGAENFNPDTESVSGPIGDIFHLLMIAMFLAADGHHLFFAALARSYDMVPVGSWELTPTYGHAMGVAINDMTIIAVAISFPVLAAVMAVTMVEGVLTRAIPQINVMHVSFAVKIILSLGVMYSGLPAAMAFMNSIIYVSQQVGMSTLSMLR